jgi:hypothetical protein
MTRRRLFLVCLSSAWLALAVGAYGQRSALMAIDIAALVPNLAPQFTTGRTGQGAAAEWSVVADPTAAEGRALVQISTDRTSHRFPVAIYEPYSGKNVEISIRFKPVAGTVDQAGGIAVRVLTPDDYYVVRANALEDNVRFYRMVKGKREQLAGTNVKVSPNSWHTLALRAEGDLFTVSYDGKELFAARNATFAGAGKVALWTKADSVTYFDTIAITPLP